MGKGKRKRAANPAFAASLAWKNVTPADPLSLLVGSDEGGFMSLEEIDGDVFVSSIPDVGAAATLAHDDATHVDELEEETGEQSEEEATDAMPTEEVEVKNDDDEDDDEDDEGIEALDMSAWADLRLHPLLQKGLCALKFSEPTPIQRACIPAAAFQGKDVIGAAETGSGKTLAFGLPILQRLLDEQEKMVQKSKNSGKGVGSPLRALIITPTRELALQVCNHLRAAAKYTNIKVVPIVGGMSTQKQQRLLKKQPQIVVGTPGRLWELMSVGESQLLDLSYLSFFVLDEADRMVEKGHFKELQTIIDMLPNNNLKPLEEPKKSSRTSNKQMKKHQEKSPEEEVYPDSDDDQELDNGDEEEEESGEEEEDEVAEQSGDEDIDMDPTFTTPNKVESMKKRQTLVFSATLALPPGFKKKLKKGHLGDKRLSKKNEYSVASLSERAGMRHNAAIIDLTTNTILAKKLEESVIECRDEEKDAFLYYILKVHGCGRTLVFCTSIAALRRVSAILRLLELPVWPLHAQMQQRARLKAMDRFKANEDCVMVATDVAARGLDVMGIRTVIHYQLPHSAEMYVHRSGRTARADTDGISIALVSPSDRTKYTTLCRALNKANGLPSFPVDATYVPATLKRVTLAVEVDKVLRRHQQSKAKQSWVKRNAEALEIDLQNSDNDDSGPYASSVEKRDSLKVESLQQELKELLKQPLEPKAFSRRYITGSGVTPLLAKQLKEYTTRKVPKKGSKGPSYQSNNMPQRGRLVVIGQEANEPLDALRKSQALKAMTQVGSTSKSKQAQKSTTEVGCTSRSKRRRR